MVYWIILNLFIYCIPKLIVSVRYLMASTAILQYAAGFIVAVAATQMHEQCTKGMYTHLR